jgi:hypothetical protein
LVSYSNLRDQRIDLFPHFAKTFLNWDGKIAPRGDLNVQQAFPNASSVEILRALNWIDYQAVGRHRPNMYIKFSRLRSDIDITVLDELVAADLGTIEISDGAESFRSSWKELNKYADCLVPRGYFFHNRPFELRAASIRYVRGNYLLNDRAIRELWNLYKRLDDSPCDASGPA